MPSCESLRRILHPTQLLVHGARHVGRPAALLVLVVFGAGWLYWDRGHFAWGAVATLLTLAMTIVIQGAQNRDTAAVQAKLDELIRAVEGAREDFVGLESKEAAEIADTRRRMHDQAKEA